MTDQPTLSPEAARALRWYLDNRFYERLPRGQYERCPGWIFYQFDPAKPVQAGETIRVPITLRQA